MAKLTTKRGKLVYMTGNFRKVYCSPSLWCNEIKVANARVEVLMAVTMKSTVFWDVDAIDAMQYGGS
jgi:hypothetical protein